MTKVAELVETSVAGTSAVVEVTGGSVVVDLDGQGVGGTNLPAITVEWSSAASPWATVATDTLTLRSHGGRAWRGRDEFVAKGEYVRIAWTPAGRMKVDRADITEADPVPGVAHGASAIATSYNPGASGYEAVTVQAAIDEVAALDATRISLTDFGDAMSEEVARADAAYFPNPNRIFIPASDFWPLTSAETAGYGDSGTPRTSHGLLLSDTAATYNDSEGGSYFLVVPSNWASVTVDVYWAPLTSAGGNVSWAGNIYNADPGETFTTGSSGSLAATASGAGSTANRLRIAQIPTAMTVDPAKLTRLVIIRNATSGTDTVTGDVVFLGVALNRVT